MKKILLIISFTLLIFLTSCNNKTYNITYIDNDETLFIKEVKENEFGLDVALDDTSTHYFIGWYLDLEDDLPYQFNSLIEEDLELYAKWLPKVFEIEFVDFDGKILKSETLAYNELIMPPNDPSNKKIGNEKYEFIRWDQDFDVANENLTITAVYNVSIEYEVIFYDINDNYLSKQLVGEDEIIQAYNYDIVDTIKYEYTFKGWTIDKLSDELFDFSKPVDCDLRLYPVYDKDQKEINYDGMRVSFIGDSITTFYSPTSPINSYYNGTNQFYYPLYSSTVKRVEDTWWHKFSTLANLQIGINNSWSGSSLYNFGSSTNSAAMNDHRILTLDDNGYPDIIFIFIGTNDNVSGVSPILFRQSYRTLLMKLNTLYPNSLVFSMTLGYSAYTGYNYTESTRLAYNKIIEEETANYDHYCVDIDSVQTIDTYQAILGDNLHPNLYGMNEYANYAYSKLIEYLN